MRVRPVPQSPCGRLIAAVLFMSASVFATTYYVSPTGDDSKSGTSKAEAKASLNQINSMSFKAGDSVLLEGGKIFTGQLIFDANDGGSPANPVVVSSYGSNRATIYAPTGNGVTIGGSGVNVKDLVVAGPGLTSGGNATGVTLSQAVNNLLDNVEAYGWTRAGIAANGNGYRITNCYAHDNGYIGIEGRGSNFYIGHCRANHNTGTPNNPPDNWSGTSIQTFGSNGVTEYCETAANGGNQSEGVDNGPVGNWFWNCTNMTIQYCVSHDNTNVSGDGGGFDIDGGSKNSRIQYCYSYKNHGPGFLICTFDDAGYPNSDNTVRYNISERDCEGYQGEDNRWGGSILLGGTTALGKTWIYNNTIYTDSNMQSVSTTVNGSPNIMFYNNIFIRRGTGKFTNTPYPYYGGSACVNNCIFKGNCWWSIDGKSAGWEGGQNSVKTFSAWQTANNQEALNGTVVGMYADPLLTAPGVGEKLTDPTQLPQLTAYKLKAGSPCIDAGVDLKAVGIADPGTRDYYGGGIPVNGKYDIGAHEYGGISVAIARPQENRAGVVRSTTIGNSGDRTTVFSATGRAVRSVGAGNCGIGKGIYISRAAGVDASAAANVKR